LGTRLYFLCINKRQRVTGAYPDHVTIQIYEPITLIYIRHKYGEIYVLLIYTKDIYNRSVEILGVSSILNPLREYGLVMRARVNKVWFFPWIAAVGLLIASRGFPPPTLAVKIIVSMFATATCIYVYNDVTDTEFDKFKKFQSKRFDRPLVSGKVSKKRAMYIALLNGIIGIFLGLLINLKTFLLILAFMSLGLAYSVPFIRLKKRIVFKEATIAVGLLLTCLAGGMSTGSTSMAVLFSGAFLSILAFTLVPAFSDQLDIEEDKIGGGKTLAIVLKWKTRVEIVIFSLLVLMTLTPLTYARLGFNVILPIFVVALCLLSLRFLFPLLSHFEDITYRKAYKAVYGFYALLPIALVLGSLQILII